MEQLENRMLLDGDHVGLPAPWVPGQGTLVALNTGAAATDKLRGRGQVDGAIAAGDTGDLFRFVIPATPGRTRDFVTVLADTIARGSTLDTRIEIYDNAGVLVATGSNNGTLSTGLGGGLAPDAWVGFEGDTGATYYARVRADTTIASGRTATGNYRVFIDASVIDMPLNTNAMNGRIGEGALEAQIGFRQEDIVYRVQTRANAPADSLAVFKANSLNNTLLNPHLDVYGSQVNQSSLRGFLRQDTDAGRLTDSFLTLRSAPSQTYYVRVRSDDLRAPANGAPIGTAVVSVQTEATVINVNAQTRLGQSNPEVVTPIGAPFPPPPAPPTAIPPQGGGTLLYSFTSQGTGVGIVSVLGVPIGLIPPLTQPAVRFFNAAGQSIDFNKGTGFAQLVVPVEGGQQYFLIVEDFDNPVDGGIQILVEAQHTFDENQGVDDHINTPPNNSLDWPLATPIRFNAPTQLNDPFGNPLDDRAWVQNGVGSGRLFRGGDTDLFQFTAPVSQLGRFGGDDGNQGQALYVGGNFLTAGNDRRTGNPVTRSNATIWDAGTWWHSGIARQESPPGSGMFTDGPFNGPIFAYTSWDPDGAGALLPVLVAGGQFTLLNGQPAQNLAFRVFNPNLGEYSWETTYGFDALGNPLSPAFGTNGPIFAFTTFDVAPNVNGDTSMTAELIIGGRFTQLAGFGSNNVGAIGVQTNGTGAAFFSPIGNGVTATGATGGVFALTVYDPPQPPTPPMGMQPPDAPAGLYIGGSFTGTSNNLVRWGKIDADPMTPFAFAAITGVNGTVNSLAVYDSPASAGNPPVAVPPRLYLGGSFTGGVFLQSYDTSRATNLAAIGGINGPVLAMTVHRPTTDGATTGTVPFLAIGGQSNANAANGFVQFINPAETVAAAFPTNGPVRSLTAFEDGTTGTPAEPVYTPGYEVLYAGGDFTQINGNNANRVARFFVGQMGPNWFPMQTGVAGISDAPPVFTTTSVFALAPFADQVTGQWDRRERAASRARLTLNAGFDGRFNGTIRVFDSNQNLVYTNDTIAAPNPDPAGALDPSLAPGVMADLTFPVWGGEVYYVEVGGAGTGRYTLNVITDSNPPVDGTGTNIAPDSTTGTPPGQGGFANAPEITPNGRGQGHNFLDPLGAQPSAFTNTNFVLTPAGLSIVRLQDLSIISQPNETHVYKFRAQNDGAAEIRIATKGITSAFRETITNVLTGAIVNDFGISKTFDSPLHGAIRVFDNDQVQLGFSDSNPAVGPQGAFVPISAFDDDIQAPTPTPPGDNGLRFFTRDDPRIIIPVERGRTYFIQVESAFRALFANNPNLVDYRFATGAYDLIINTTPSLNGVDDHFPDGFSPTFITSAGGTPIPINNQTGTGSISGIVQNIPTGPFANPNDADTFQFYAMERGQSQVRITPTDPLLAPRVRIFQFDPVTGVTNQLATGAGSPGQAAVVNFPVQKGERFFVVVDGTASQGGYVVDVTTPVATDDQPFSDATPNDQNDTIAGWANAAPLQLNRFLGLYGQPGTSGAITAARGSIESPDDTDIFTFTAEAFEFATVQVNRVDTTMDPTVIVYEIGQDGLGQNVLLIVARNDDISGSNFDAQATFSVTQGQTYFVVVRASDPVTNFGRYTLQVNVAPTDDHPNRLDFPAGTIIDLTLDQINFTSSGSATGGIERNTDNDLFRFTAPATGTGRVVLARATGSTLALNLTILDSNNVPLAGVTFVTTANSITANIPSISQGQQYYVLVSLPTPIPGGATDTGAYTLSVNTDPIDDFLPTPGTATPAPSDFTGATNIVLSSTNGVGSLTGILVPTGDSDLFRFDALAAGPATVRITTPQSNLNPRIIIFNASQVQTFDVNGNGDSAVVNFNALAARFYVLVLAATTASGATAVGSYSVTITSSIPGGGGPGPQPDDFPNAGEFNDADARAVIGTDTRTGNGEITGVINTSGDTDLFRLNIAGSGLIDIQLSTPSGGLVDGQIKIFNSSRVQILSDSAGILGATAAVRFTANAGEFYYILVEPVGAATGTYTLRAATQPLQHFLYFPEGFAGATIDEFVPIVNPNTFAVDYQVFARYEVGDNPDVPIFTGNIAANSRGGLTVTTRSNLSAALVRVGVPYALEIRSTGPLGATFSHYDFSASIGEAFTNRVSSTWTFAEVNKDRNTFRDFLLFYNPGNVAANLNITLYYQDGAQFTFNQTVDAKRRGGINVDGDGRVPRTGRFGVKITSDQPIVSSLSSYNLSRSGGDGLLGDADGGSTRGVVTNVSSGAGVASNLSILNTNTNTAIVTIVADYARTDIPRVVRVVNVQPGRQFTLALSDLGLIPGQTAGISYSSNVGVTFSVFEYQRGDANFSTTATSAARQFFFGDLFINPASAGITYIEQLGLFNPSQVAIDISVRFLFADGSPTATTTVRVGAGSFAFVSIDQQPAILSRPNATAFSLVVDSATPFVASMTHYDLFLNGGWSALGSPIGLTTPLSTII